MKIDLNINHMEWQLDRAAFGLTFKGIVFIMSMFIFSCDSFVDVGPPIKELSPQVVFTDKQSATAAVLGVYANLWSVGYDIERFTGRSSDEFQNFSSSLEDEQFFVNELTSDNVEIENLWRNLYKPIYGANAVIEGLSHSSRIAIESKNQLEGEARFLRAFSYFYLVNLFGEVPLVTETDYRTNSVLPKSTVSEIYDLIVADLLAAENLLSGEYISGEKVRANKLASSALLSRVYLYLRNWEAAESYAGSVINSSKYSLDVISDPFLANSNEAILQFYPVSFSNTQEGINFILTSAPPFSVAFTNHFVDGFEVGDLRRSNWIGEISDPVAGTYYYPFKYKVAFEEVKTEYVMVLRLAEQYLISAEAKVNQNNILGAIADIDEVRSRAGLSLIQDVNPGISQADLLLVIEQERKVELFTEWGHRWFDLKRTNRATEVLSTFKVEWQDDDQLYPIPLREISTNPLLE